MFFSFIFFFLRVEDDFLIIDLMSFSSFVLHVERRKSKATRALSFH
jgi:hypothetical protein